MKDQQIIDILRSEAPAFVKVVPKRKRAV